MRNDRATAWGVTVLLRKEDRRWTAAREKERKATRDCASVLPFSTAPDDRVDLISISRNSMITKARESVGKRRACRDDLYFQLDPRRIEGAPLN